MLNNLNSKGVENIIISGGNDLFIKIYLKEHGLDKYFSAIIANKMN
jgi:phosphoglycolate phosphatase-like HAD superfamily hydrolase